MSGELQVTTADLRKLSEQQQQVASGITAAGQAVNGTTPLVIATHGPVCAPTIAAIGAAGASRDAAVAAMQQVSTSLAEKLGIASAHYDRTDQTKAGQLDGQMHGR
ncbi:ESX-1 secretion-associated protein [Mycolicibacterium lutetiense]|jgi:hypothetical protein|uniref:ESX-1 secretion-associated protein n=1 Tax=Mycolicibacterium lutetiense TaxID=1641992 RepID=A0ABS5A0Y7_9MYCO|nr:ESX-1 secretion-associated protein [Mycolicibacterium lutetiense]MBP2455093.1 hypothetical protein [Mycolicibacterium lutetiense]